MKSLDDIRKETVAEFTGRAIFAGIPPEDLIINIGDIATFADLISTYTTGFTTTNVPASTPAVASAKFNYEQITRSIAKIANAVGWDWYVDYNALKTAEAIKGAEHKKKILILDTEKKTEEQLEEWFATLLTTHDVTSIDQIGKQRFAVTALENAPDIK